MSDYEPIILTHFSEEPLVLDYERVYEQEERSIKPRGFWLSDESEHGWLKWSTEEEFGLHRLLFRTEFRVKRGSNVLLLTSLEEILEFTAKHRQKPKWVTTPYSLPDDERPGQFNVFRGHVNWPEVTERYDGILITPYDWHARMHSETMWYYGWDCASGCFWNLSAIEQISESVPVPESERTAVPYEPYDDEPERTEVPLIPGGYTMTSIEVPRDDYQHNSIEDRA